MVKLYNKTSLILQPSYSQILVELGQKFGQITQQDKSNTTAQLLVELEPFTTRRSYSQTSVELEPKFGQIIQQIIKLYNTFFSFWRL